MSKILIGYSACPLTRQAFEAQGHEAWTCDLLPARGDQSRHIQCDIWEVATDPSWDFGVFHPMCTYMNVASAWALKDPDFERYPDKGGYHQRIKPGTLVGHDRRAAQAESFENFRRLEKLKYPRVIENPAPSSLSTNVRKPDQIIHPYQFGDDASKGTGHWLAAGVPLLKHTGYVEPRLVCENRHTFEYGETRCPECGSQKYLPRWANQTDSGQNRLSPGEDRWLDRSETWPGIAAALGYQYGRWLNS